jgi:hypothetical protein
MWSLKAPMILSGFALKIILMLNSTGQFPGMVNHFFFTLTTETVSQLEIEAY